MTGSWDYSMLSSMAKAAGGPKAFIHTMRFAGLLEGILICLAIQAIRYFLYRYVYKPAIEDLQVKINDNIPGGI